MKGKPKVILIALYSNNVFIGAKTWSWYIPIITSKFFLFLFKNIVSAGKGPNTLIFYLTKYLIAGEISTVSSLFFAIDSQWGFRPKIAIFGSLLSLDL